MGLIFDTSELIWAERRGLKVADLLRRFSMLEGIGVSTMTIAELQHGVRRAVTETQRMTRQQFMDSVEKVFPVYPLHTEAAKILGNIDAELAMQGEKLDLADLIIAATALALNFSVVTRNTKHFSRVKGLHIIVSE
jgi:tRNA(fMet)-specific endonuclease VapC